MRKLAFCVLCVALCLIAIASPRPAAADCHEGCCDRAYQDVEYYCSYSYVSYFRCIEGYQGSCCAVWYQCAPPPV